jgi:hypothetical protein
VRTLRFAHPTTLMYWNVLWFPLLQWGTFHFSPFP